MALMLAGRDAHPGQNKNKYFQKPQNAAMVCSKVEFHYSSQTNSSKSYGTAQSYAAAA